MPATDTDQLLFQAVPRFKTTIGSGGVASNSADTIPLSSTTGLTNGNAYIITINRVNSSGEKNTLAQMETAIGKLSSSNLIDCIRGSEGTAQAWEQGTVVEILSTATQWNKLVEWAETDHNADGTHGDIDAEDITADSVTIGGLAAVTTSATQTLTNKTINPANNTLTGVATLTGTETLTNKRINKRVVSATSYTTDTGTSLDVSTCDEFVVTAQGGALKFNNPSGTPAQGQPLLIRIKDNGTARALTYDTQFRAIGVTLPTTTVISKTLYIGAIYNSTDTKWDVLAVGQES